MVKKKDSLVPSQNAGFFQDLIQRIKLVWRLLVDRRVNLFLKLLPVASLVYLLSPIDLAPEITLPVIGVLDDAVVLWIGTSLFVNLCPEGVVQEHLQNLRGVIQGTWREPEPGKESQIIEVTPRETDEEDKDKT